MSTKKFIIFILFYIFIQYILIKKNAISQTKMYEFYKLFYTNLKIYGHIF